MDPALKTQLEQLLAGLLKNTQDAASWAKAELPLLIKEKIAFGRAFDTTILVLSVAACYYLIPRMWRATHKFVDGDTVIFGTAGCGVASVMLVGLTLFTLRNTLLVWFAPRLYIVEWLISLIRYGV
jgi:hypothetical protein